MTRILVCGSYVHKVTRSKRREPSSQGDEGVVAVSERYVPLRATITIDYVAGVRR